MVGRTIGKYRIVAAIGRGATGSVYKAVDQSLDREVAIKVLSPDLADRNIVRRFRAEATTLAKLNHPHIATVYELVHAENDLLLVMEFIRGETLERLSDRVPAMAPAHAASIIDRVLSALEHAHRAGIIHRDVKPANIMITDGGVVKIMDFGIARVRGGERMTIDGGMMGTPAYISPEQVLGQEVDARGDLYSVGVVLYRLLAGALPFSGDTMAVLQKQVTQPPPPLHTHRGDLPEWCQAIVGRALEKSPADRYQTAEAFRDALARAAGLSTGIDLARALPIAAPEIPPAAAEPAPAGTVMLTIPEPARAASRWTWARGGIAGALAAVLLSAVVIRPAVRLMRANSFPAVVFQAKTLVGAGTRQREMDARLTLANGKVVVGSSSNAEHPLYEIPFEDVISINYSHSHDPIWKSPDGPTVVVHARGGALAMLGVSVERDWISLETDTQTTSAGRFVVLSVDDQVVGPMLAALEERTGRTPLVLNRR
jgi:tRNA A-37 threonylcarbamoyl transferase component Bud32